MISKKRHMIVLIIFYVFDVSITIQNIVSIILFSIREIQYSATNEWYIETVFNYPLPYILNLVFTASIVYHAIIVILHSITASRWKSVSISVAVMVLAEIIVQVTRYIAYGRFLINYYTYELLVLILFEIYKGIFAKKEISCVFLAYPRYPYIAMIKKLTGLF